MLPVLVPIVHRDRPPEGNEALLFESTTANELLEGFLPANNVERRLKQARAGLEWFEWLAPPIVG